MAKDMNNLNIVGRLTADCKIKTVGTLTIGEFSIAVNDIVKRANGYEDEVSFFNVSIFGKLAENLSQYLLKGKRIGVTGKLKQNRWSDQAGNNQSRIIIIGNEIQLLESKGTTARETEEAFKREDGGHFNDGTEF